MTDVKDSSCLFIGDPNLGEIGSKIVRACFPKAQVVIWTLGDKAGKEHVRNQIRSQKWSLTFSFYSDLVLLKEDLDCMDLPLNIHPALPEVPGLGYDIVPINQRHSHYGATLHWMDIKVDSGEIFDVLKYPLPAQWNRTTLRKMNQVAAIDMLRHWVSRLSACPNREGRIAILRESACADWRWNTNRVTRKQLQAMLLSEPFFKPGLEWREPCYSTEKM